MPASNHSFFAPASGIRPLFHAKIGRFDVEVGACMKGYVALVAESPWAIVCHADIDLLRDYMVSALAPYQSGATIMPPRN